jgi:hypothetical protein
MYSHPRQIERWIFKVAHYRKRTDAKIRRVCGYNFRLVNPVSPPNLRTRLRRIFLRAILYVVGAGLLAFVTDWAVFRVRVATNRSPYDSVTVRHYYAVQLKNGKTEFIFDPPQPWTCVNALFPHAGCLPCWYLKRHPEQRTDI